MFYATKFCNFTSNLSYFMKEKNQLVNSKKLSNIIAKSMKDKKAKEVSIINFEKIKNSICDYFVICSGNSYIQLDSIAENIEKKVYENTNEKPWKKEGEFKRLSKEDLATKAFELGFISQLELDEITLWFGGILILGSTSYMAWREMKLKKIN